MRNNKNTKVSIVIPFYNEELVISNLYKRLTKAAKSWGLVWEVICIDDGSKDNTLAVLKKYNKINSQWKVISFSRNFGHQIAISCGLFHATGNAVIIIDADLQDPPEELHRYIKKWQEGYDVVYAVRKKRKEGFFKRVSYWIFYRLISKLSTEEMPLDSGDFSLMDKKVVDIIRKMPEKNRYVRGLRSWAGFKQIGLEYERNARVNGETKYPLKKLVKLAADGIFSFSSFPLTLASYLGIAVSVCALIGIIFTFLQKIFEAYFTKLGIGPVPGFATIVIAILFLGGVQLIFLGIMGNYISRIYDEVKGRPQWIIKEWYGIESKHEKK